jgi:hypothetical protein
MKCTRTSGLEKVCLNRPALLLDSLVDVVPTFAYSSYALIQPELGMHRIGGEHPQGNLLFVAFVDESNLRKRGDNKSRVIL